MAGVSKPARAKRERTRTNSLVELVGIVLFALLLAFLIQLFLVKTYRIPSPSMVPTLDVGQRVLVNRIGTHFGDPSVGDIIVFHPPAGADAASPVCGDAVQGGGDRSPCSEPTPQRSNQTFVKRVVGVGGDTIQIRDGRVIRNGRATKESFIQPCAANSAAQCTFSGTITVPKGDFYMMGDNRGDSDDSRYWGPVPKKWIIGKAFATYWPPKRIGIF